MIVAKKDHLRIEVKMLAKKVNISMPEMDDVRLLWDEWIKQEERQAETFLKSGKGDNSYPELAIYLQEKGWEIEEIKFSQS